MSDEPLEDLYFDWLCARVMLPHSVKYVNYNGLLQVLHRTEFVWVVSGDDNRAEDGIELRSDFLRETHFYQDPMWLDVPCSMLEMLIALAYRAAFQTRISTENWFWKFIENLNLNEFRRISEDDIQMIQEIVNTFIWRNYQANGSGGLFPLHSPPRDQRKVEIWYQFGDYVEDQRLI